MFLSIENPGGDKFVSIFGRDLKGDADYDPMRNRWSDWDSDRSRVDRAVEAVNRLMAPEEEGRRCGKAFNLFNQFTWTDTTGWEYWSRDMQLMLQHALLTAASLKVPLNVHVFVMDDVMDAAVAVGIKFDFDYAKPVAQPHNRDFVYINRQIEGGQYFELTGVVLPSNMPEAPALD
jgi:hypothetical protein